MTIWIKILKNTQFTRGTYRDSRNAARCTCTGATVQQQACTVTARAAEQWAFYGYYTVVVTLSTFLTPVGGGGGGGAIEEKPGEEKGNTRAATAVAAATGSPKRVMSPVVCVCVCDSRGGDARRRRNTTWRLLGISSWSAGNGDVIVPVERWTPHTHTNKYTHTYTTAPPPKSLFFINGPLRASRSRARPWNRRRRRPNAPERCTI